MHITPDWVFQQAYSDTLTAGVNRRMIPKPLGQEWGTPTETSDYHDRLNLPSHRETLTVQFQGKLVRAKIHKITDQPHKHHKRGKITGFSAQSRGRLFDIFNSMELRNPVIFLTLTYEKDQTSAPAAKAHLRAFIKRIQRLYENRKMAFVWRMEFQERGAVHFHIMAFNLPFTPKETIKSMWAQVIGGYDPFTRIEMIYSAKKTMNYVGKYVAKVDKQDLSGFNPLTYLSAYQKKHGDEIGRVWGIIGKSNLPMAELVICEIGFNYAKFMQFKEFAAQLYPPIMESLSLGFRLYVMSAKHWEYLFHKIYDIQF
jgi:hypothetical protein